MKNFAVCIALTAVFCIAACGSYESGPSRSFDYKLQGTWESNDKSVYSGTLKIVYNEITITGYSEDQTPLLGDDTKRPFRDIVKNVPLQAFVEDGKIFIIKNQYPGEGISFEYWETGSSYPKAKLLTFTFGGRNEVLQKVEE
jgi:hypothetical protein